MSSNGVIDFVPIHSLNYARQVASLSAIHKLDSSNFEKESLGILHVAGY